MTTPIVTIFDQPDIIAEAGRAFEAVTEGIPPGGQGAVIPTTSTTTPPAPEVHGLTQPRPAPVAARTFPYHNYFYRAEFIDPQDGSARLPETMFEITMNGVAQQFSPPANAFVNNLPPVRIATKNGEVLPETGGVWWVRMTAFAGVVGSLGTVTWSYVNTNSPIAQGVDTSVPDAARVRQLRSWASIFTHSLPAQTLYHIIRIPIAEKPNIGNYRLEIMTNGIPMVTTTATHITDDNAFAYYYFGVIHQTATINSIIRLQVSTTSSQNDPANYDAAEKVDQQASYNTVFRIIVPGRQEPVLNWLRWRDPVQERSPIRHDFGHTRALLMSLPSWAPKPNLLGGEGEAGDHIHNAGIVIGNEQYLVIDNIQEMILPRIESKEQPKLIEVIPINQYGGERYLSPGDTSANTAPSGSGVPDDAKDLPVTAAYQSGTVIGKAIVRVLWNNEYLSHGGQYGVRVMGMTRFPPPQWLYYIKPHWNETTDRWTQGQVLLQWQGFISKFTERVTQEGIFVDFEITCESAPALPYRIRRTPLGEDDRYRPHTQWPVRPDNRNFPSIEWPQVYF